ncbi:unnamed protein product [Chilo suppressalis]|uniref:Exonuclease domain-containing protein n=1 Tax=Chilo suppressalis TaxID=168631 RepID=A0ABN8BBS9_CHISP|nr:unnamed protein product [Chilo suppressalis]
MCKVNTFVFFDIETTGLPWQERNRTKITELSFVAALRQDILLTSCGEIPPISKLTLVFNPIKAIHPEAVKMTGLSNDILKFSPTFERKIDTIISFLQELPKPVCLVAHNGNLFDFKILLTEINDANASLPSDLLCVDSLVGFRFISKNRNTPTSKNVHVIPMTSVPQKTEISADLMTDDEDEWPDLNVSTEDWQDIDDICNNLSDISCEDITEDPIIKVDKKKRSEVIQKVFKKEKKPNPNPNPNGYSLEALYKKFFRKDPINLHRAEGDCLMLLQCVVADKENFIPWADNASCKITEIKPLVRR